MSLSPNSSLVRRTIDLKYANKQRSNSFKWIFINGTLFILFTFDLWYKCPGYTSVLHYCEAAAACAACAAAARHALRLLPRRAPRTELTRRQQCLLGLKDEDLDSSFHVSPDGAPAAAAARAPAAAAEAPASLSPPRTWRTGGSPRAPPAPPSPPSPPERDVRDEFIADRDALDRYLSAREAAEATPDEAERSRYSLLPAATVYRLAPLRAEPGGADDGAPGAGAPGATLWRRLHVDPQHLAQFNLNLRRWLHATILERVVRELEECEAALAAAGQEARPGWAAPARLAAVAAAAPPPLARRLRALLPFLRPFADQKYAVERVRALARGGCLAAYRWDGGGPGWDATRPADADLVLHLFAAYMDGVVPEGGGGGGAFSAAHVSSAPAPPPRAPGALALHRTSRAPPHYVLVLGEDTVEVCRGRDNLLHSLLLFLAAAAREEPPALRRLHLGPAGLNMLWILGR